MQTNIKICGLREPQGFESMLDGRITSIGFVFAPSRRKVDPTVPFAWRTLINHMPEHLNPPLLTGVFVNPTVDEVLRMVENGSLDVVQLHGQESVDTCRSIRDALKEWTIANGNRGVIQVWKALTIMEGEEVPIDTIGETIEKLAPFVDLFLVDTHDPQYGGGSGKTFSWDVLPQLQRTANKCKRPLWVAGGLNPDNVRTLIDTYHPDGVDISSGVETDQHKDIHKIDLFIKRVKSNDNMA